MNVQLVNENFKNNWVNNILISRGIHPEIIDDIKHPSLHFIQPPNALVNISVGAAAILDAVNNKKHIGMIIDSDTDGITSATIMYTYLHELDEDVNITYFFHEHKQHGLEDCWEKFIDAKVDLVIEVDAGINDAAYHDLLGEANIITVVGDHHIYEGNGMSKYAIYIDNQCSPNYTNKSLAGCGVSWQICRMIDILNHTDYAFKYIDLVALGCCADVMSPITLENRVIFEYGFSHPQHPMFLALLDKQSYSMKNVVNYTTVAFYIAPLINAMMRTGTAEEKLLMYKAFLHPSRTVESNKRGAKGEIVNILEEACRVLANVKARQTRLTDKYEEIINYRIMSEGLDDNNVIVIRLQDSDDFASELNGLIATKISNKYHKPCYIVRDGLDNLTKGSGRNPTGSPIDDLKELVDTCPYIDHTLGHSQAHGCFIHTPSVDKFVEWFNEQTKNLNFNSNTYNINFLINSEDNHLYSLCQDVVDNINLWGGDNPVPVVYLNHFILHPEDIKIMGQNKDTISFTIGGVKCIKFLSKKLGEELAALKRPIVIDLIGTPDANVYQGRTSVQLKITDLEYKYLDLEF